MNQLKIGQLKQCAKSVIQKDFFGIRDITSKDIAACFSNKTILRHDQFQEKYEPLLVARTKLANEEKENDQIFGHVRRDTDNTPEYHGQYDANNKRMLYDTISVKQAFVPDTDDNPGPCDSGEEQTDGDDTVIAGYNPPYKISEVQAVENIADIIQKFKKDRPADANLRYSNKPPLTFFFECAQGQEPNRSKLFSQSVNPQSSTKSRDASKSISGSNPVSESTQPASKLSHTNKAHTSVATDSTPASCSSNQQEMIVKRPQLDIDRITDPKDDLLESKDELRFDKSIDRKYDVKPNESKPKKKAIDFVEDLKKESEYLDPLDPRLKLDSKGKRVYTNQVPNWFNSRRKDILAFLERCIIYNNYDILAVNKPYGLSSHTDQAGKYEDFNINDLMFELVKQKFRTDELYLTHRLDKTTTGVLLFARRKQKAAILHKQFKADEIKKTYLALVRGIPDPEEGIIDIPISEMMVGGKLRMCPVPEKLPEKLQLARHYTEARRAVTEYRTLDFSKGVSLVEVKPRSGVKHQIRCHLGFGLKTPILGDHKYTDIGRMLPQKLADRTLGALQLRQSKVRTLPIHLHAKTIVIPYAKANDETLFIDAPLPHHFRENMKALGLKSDGK